MVGARSTIVTLLMVVTAATFVLIGLRLPLVETRPIVRSDCVEDSASAIARRATVPATTVMSSDCTV